MCAALQHLFAYKKMKYILTHTHTYICVCVHTHIYVCVCVLLEFVEDSCAKTQSGQSQPFRRSNEAGYKRSGHKEYFSFCNYASEQL